MTEILTQKRLAWDIDTSARRLTQTRRLHTFIDVDARVGTHALSVAGGARAAEAAVRVDARLSAVVLVRATLVYVTTRQPVRVQNVALHGIK